MPKLLRRQTMKLGAAAMLVGPSVLVSRSAFAKKIAIGGIKGGQFTVKLAGIYDEVPGVISVDLGSLKFVKLGTAPQYAPVKIALAAGTDASKMTLNFAPELKQKKVAVVGQKISIALLAVDGKTPAITYHAQGAVPISITTNKVGEKLLSYKVESIAIDGHKVEGGGIKLPGNALKVEIEGIGTASASAVSKWFYDNQDKTYSKHFYDGIKLETTAQKVESKVESNIIKLGDKISVSAYVTTSDTQISSALIESQQKKVALDGVKILAAPKGGVPAKGKVFAKVMLTSVELPKLQVGNDALVTETFNFSFESSKG